MTPQKNTPDTNQIAALAHKLWEDEGRPDGRAEIHWQTALQCLNVAKSAPAKAAKPVPTKAAKPSAKKTSKTK